MFVLHQKRNICIVFEQLPPSFSNLTVSNIRCPGSATNRQVKLHFRRSNPEWTPATIHIQYSIVLAQLDLQQIPFLSIPLIPSIAAMKVQIVTDHLYLLTTFFLLTTFMSSQHVEIQIYSKYKQSVKNSTFIANNLFKGVKHELVASLEDQYIRQWFEQVWEQIKDQYKRVLHISWTLAPVV